MSKNVKLNNQNYTGVSTVQIPTTNGGTAEFKDVDEIITPSGAKTITANGTHDVSAYAQAVVNVPTGGDSPVLQTKSVTITENGTTQILPDDGNDGMTEVNVTVDVPASGGASGLKTYRTTSTGSNSIVIDGIDLTAAKMIYVQFKSRTADRESTDPAYAFYAGALWWCPELLDDSLKAVNTGTTSQAGTSVTRNFLENDFANSTTATYFSTNQLVRNWAVQTFDITSERTTITIKNIGLEPSHVYDIIVHYV